MHAILPEHKISHGGPYSFHTSMYCASFLSYGTVPDDFGMDEVACTGNEESIRDCPSQAHDCDVHEGAGVVCEGKPGCYNLQQIVAVQSNKTCPKEISG